MNTSNSQQPFAVLSVNPSLNQSKFHFVLTNTAQDAIAVVHAQLVADGGDEQVIAAYSKSEIIDVAAHMEMIKPGGEAS